MDVITQKHIASFADSFKHFALSISVGVFFLGSTVAYESVSVCELRVAPLTSSSVLILFWCVRSRLNMVTLCI